MSCSSVSPLKIVAVCLVVVAFVLHPLGFSAKKWDAIDTELYGHHYDAYQNLWQAYDNGIWDGSYAVYSRVDTSIPGWKMQIILLETTGLGLAVLSSLSLVLSSFCKRISQNRRIQVTMVISSVLGFFVAAGETIVGVKLYQEEYLNIISVNGNAMIKYERKNQREIYHLTWAPYLCTAAGGVYILISVILVIDLILAAVKARQAVSVSPSKS